MKVGIIDYGSGNLRSAAKAFERAATEAEIAVEIDVTSDPEAVAGADRVVLPGVGAFADCRRGLAAAVGLEPAMREAFGVSLFDYLAGNPEAAAHFNEAMVAIHGGDGADVTATYDFSGFQTIVDVGGGTGVLLSTILAANPHLHGVLYDLPQTASQARTLIQNRGLASRCEAHGGDYFLDIPEGHDAYILSHVLHDWTDEQALPILRNCRRAIRPEGRLLILEAVLPEGDTPHPGKMMDLLMLTVTGGLERTGNEYSQLLARAGFRVGRIIPLASDQSIVEALPSTSEER